MFETEAKVFESHRSAWLAAGELDRWVSIHGKEVLGFWGTLGEAVEAVRDRFGTESVFIRQVTVEDKPEVIQRLAW